MKVNNLNKVIVQVKDLNKTSKSYEQRFQKIEKILTDTWVFMYKGFNMEMPESSQKTYSRKDPEISTIGPSESRPVRVGDSTANILAKMFNFQRKVHEQDVKKREVEKDFKKEQVEENERRHKALLQSIGKVANETAKRLGKKDKVEGEDKGIPIIDMILGGVKGLIGIISKGLGMIISNIGYILPFAAAAHFIYTHKDDVEKFMEKVNSGLDDASKTVDEMTKPLQVYIGNMYLAIKEKIYNFVNGIFKYIGSGLSNIAGNFHTDPLGSIDKILQFLSDPMAGVALKQKEDIYGKDYIKLVEGIIKGAPNDVYDAAFPEIFGAHTRSMESKINDVLEKTDALRYLTMPSNQGKERDRTGRVIDEDGMDYEHRRRTQRDMMDQMLTVSREYIQGLGLNLDVREINQQGVPIIIDKDTGKEVSRTGDIEALKFSKSVTTALRDASTDAIDWAKGKSKKASSAYYKAKNEFVYGLSNQSAQIGQQTLGQLSDIVKSQLEAYGSSGLNQITESPIFKEKIIPQKEKFVQGMESVNQINLPGKTTAMGGSGSGGNQHQTNGTVWVTNQNDTIQKINWDNLFKF